ncbi:MAG TPA: ABC transporter substrate-binding protein [Dictyoglomaceae bacterium]|nr:ABC transporter substrate-binding protein [Dictyoglomaceae bacterium]
MRVFKRIFSWVLALSLLMLSLGISVGVEVANAQAKLYKPLNPTPEAKNPVTFKVYIGEVNPNDDQYRSPVAQKIKELTGVTLDIEYAPNQAAVREKIQIMAASGDYPDLVYAKGDLELLKDAGALISMDDLIDKYAPNIKKAYGDNLKRLKWSKDDPHIYCLGAYGTDNDRVLDVDGGFMLQHRVVMELGYPKIRTLQDFENAIKTYYKKHPTTDGLPTIPLTLCADDWRTVISVTNPAFQATGAPDDGEIYVDPKTLKCVFHYKRPIEKTYFKWLNHMWNIGLLDKETFIQKEDSYKAKIANGRVLALIDAGWAVGEPLTALRRAGKYDYMYGFYPVTVSASVKQAPPDVRAGYTGGWGVAITKSCKDPVRAIKFLDWLCSEDSNILRQWGIEGVHHTYVDGKRVFLPEVENARTTDPYFGRKTGIGVYIYPWPRLPNYYIDSTGNPVVPDTRKEDIRKNYTDVEKKVLAAYGVEIWKDLFPKAEEYPVKTWGYLWMYSTPDEDIRAIGNKLFDYVIRSIPKVVMAPTKDFDKVWSDFLKGMDDLGAKKYEDYKTQQIKEMVNFWKK